MQLHLFTLYSERFNHEKNDSEREREKPTSQTKTQSTSSANEGRKNSISPSQMTVITFPVYSAHLPRPSTNYRLHEHKMPVYAQLWSGFFLHLKRVYAASSDFIWVGWCISCRSRYLSCLRRDGSGLGGFLCRSVPRRYLVSTFVRVKDTLADKPKTQGHFHSHWLRLSQLQLRPFAAPFRRTVHSFSQCFIQFLRRWLAPLWLRSMHFGYLFRLNSFFCLCRSASRSPCLTPSRHR